MALPKLNERQSFDRHYSKSNIGLEILSLSLYAVAAFLLVAILSFNGKDPSGFSLGNEFPLNACGRVGAFLSAVLLHTFGLSGFLVPPAFIFGALSIHDREGSTKFFVRLLTISVSAVSFSVFVSLYWSKWNYGGIEMLSGGAVGLLSAESLKQFFNSTGAGIVSLFVFCSALVVSVPVSLASFIAKTLRALSIIAFRASRIALTYAVYFAAKSSMAFATFMKDKFEDYLERRREIAKIKPALRTKTTQDERDSKIITVSATSDLVSQANEADEREEESEDGVIRGKTENEPIVLKTDTNSSAHSEAFEIKKQAVEKIKEKEVKPLRHKGAWKLPSIEFLRKPPKTKTTVDDEKLRSNASILQQKLYDLGVTAQVRNVFPGPVITLYEVKLASTERVNKIASLADDLAMALSAKSVRILAPMPGRDVVGIEIPSDTRETVVLREFLQHEEFQKGSSQIPIVMGKDIGGAPIFADLARMPHLLVAGQTGSGKSVFMNGLICSLLYRFSPDELRMILVDPKVIEFASYEDIPHLLLPVVDDPKSASTALKWAVREMERRYQVLSKVGVRNLAAFNAKVEELGIDVIKDLMFEGEDREKPNRPKDPAADWIQCFEMDENGDHKIGKLPFIVIILDELADLMIVAKKEVETSIARLSAKARASGIHLVIATQRPSTDVITGTIKSNLPTRVSFQLSSAIDSNTILTKGGAEKLLGLGDMLFVPPGSSSMTRLQGGYVGDDEMEKITGYLRSLSAPIYRTEILVDEEEEAENELAFELDALFDQAVELSRNKGTTSASFLQRHLSIGYNRAANLIETMEKRGIVGAADGARPREVLM